MTAQPIHQEDPYDPEVIHRRLPEQERPVFLARYHEVAQAAADDITRYRRLKEFLHAWSLRAHAMAQPGRREAVHAEIEAIHNGTAKSIPLEAVLAEQYGLTADEAKDFWQRKVEQARSARQNRA